MRIAKGFANRERAEIAALYWQAFGAKLGRVMGPEAKALRFIEAVLDPDHAICARDDTGAVLGVVGFKTYHGALVGGGWADMQRAYGLWGAAWRSAALSLLERDVDNERFLMDGIFVTAAARGRGVGTALLQAIAQEARGRGYDRLRLDVINTNPRARALYERFGFVAVDEQKMGPLRWVFGFDAATTMVLDVSQMSPPHDPAA